MVEERGGRRSYDLIARDITDLKEELLTLNNKVDGLLDAWNTANGVVRFMKWIASIVTAATIIWAALTGHYK